MCTNSRDTALRMVLIQTAVATFNEAGALSSDHPEYRQRLVKVYMMSTLADRIEGASAVPEHNPEVIAMGYVGIPGEMAEWCCFGNTVVGAVGTKRWWRCCWR